jgi:hypothetical protein
VADPRRDVTGTPAVQVVEDALFDVPTQGGQTPQARPPRPRPISEDVTAVLDVLNTDPALADDRRAVVTAILTEARAQARFVDPNRVRVRLAGPDGRPALKRPQVVGAVYARLVHVGVLAFDGWIENTDKASGNAGRPARAYRLVRIPDTRDAAA